ncbi:MAG TPA: hypothetical protein VHL80_09255 [Polyangia bacterium]|nr:hypothetical protein [Polyangia bacterium]
MLSLTLAAVAPKSGASMCALTAEDFKAAGVPGAGELKARVRDDGVSAYCVYGGRSSATGGIELDVFYPAGLGVTEARATFEFTAGDLGRPDRFAKVPGADEARWTPSASTRNGPPFSAIVVRKGTLVFAIAFPASKKAQKQLTTLAGVALKRF